MSKLAQIMFSARSWILTSLGNAKDGVKELFDHIRHKLTTGGEVTEALLEKTLLLSSSLSDFGAMNQILTEFLQVNSELHPKIVSIVLAVYAPPSLSFPLHSSPHLTPQSNPVRITSPFTSL